jgi:hypothetical protein
VISLVPNQGLGGFQYIHEYWRGARITKFDYLTVENFVRIIIQQDRIAGLI